VARLRATAEIAVLYFIVETLMGGYGGSLVWVVGINIRVERACEVNGRPPGQTTEGNCVDGKKVV
jgi:hypothetical protein